jgi:hypothetical protein
VKLTDTSRRELAIGCPGATVGIELTFGREGRTRTIRLTAAPENVGARPSALSDPEISSLRSNGLPADRWRTVLRTITGPIPRQPSAPSP